VKPVLLTLQSVQVQMLASVWATAWLLLTSLLAPTAKWSLHWAEASVDLFQSSFIEACHGGHE
jgi:hypothetical protein